MSLKPAPADEPSAPTRGSKMRARALLIGLGLLVVAYATALLIRPYL